MPDRPAQIEVPCGDAGVTWRVLLARAASLLEGAGTPAPAIDARWIVEEASGHEGADLHLALDDVASTACVASYQQMVSRRFAGEPLQYVLGHWPFRTLDLAIDRRVLIPRPETEVVAGVALDELRLLAGGPRPLVAVDLGTGSGAIGLALAAELSGSVAIDVWLTDASPDALDVARANLAGIGQAATRVRLAGGHWFDALSDDMRGGIDLVVSNPPYIASAEELPATVDRWEPAAALRAGPSGVECYEAIISTAPTWLRRPGTLVVEIAPHQGEVVVGLMRDAGAVSRSGNDMAGRRRWVAGRWL